MQRDIISTDQAPAAVGPYSQAVRVGQFIYTAGQVAIDPALGRLIEGDVSEQTEQVLRNLTAVLEAAGATRQNVVKTTVFLRDMADFAAMNQVYGRYFGQNPPARSTIGVAGLPLGALVEIEAVAVTG
jgi:2-iminobutanoate/2-iminopropanoate deaminase